MSERGSFVTEYIYCAKCFQAAKDVLLVDSPTPYLIAYAVPSPFNAELLGVAPVYPIIAGKIGGTYSGNEFVTFETELIPELEKAICHDLRIAVLSDSAGERFYRIQPEEQLLNQERLNGKTIP